MAEKKQCITCGHTFEVCTRCEELSPSLLNQYGHVAWQAVACSNECWQIYTILRNYFYKHISKDEAKMALSVLNIPKNILKESVKNNIREIMDENESRVDIKYGKNYKPGNKVVE